MRRREESDRANLYFAECKHGRRGDAKGADSFFAAWSEMDTERRTTTALPPLRRELGSQVSFNRDDVRRVLSSVVLVEGTTWLE